ncbi:MAG: HAD family hydrolase [Succiniclasticum sp.]|jgi:phosphoglycolate phosphatase
MLYFAWDVDGTLLLTNRAGSRALQDAIRDYLRVKEPYEFKESLAGRTDSGIIKEIVTNVRGRCTSGWAAGLMLTYEMRQKYYLRKHEGYLMTNVERTLSYFKEHHPEIGMTLLTGNTTEGAHDKVKEYGIDEYFDFRHGGYGDLAENRDDVARILYTRLYNDGLIRDTSEIIIFGDTPRDVHCANAIGARCIIVLDGSEYPRDAFTGENKPWQLLDKLPDNPEELYRLVTEKEHHETCK